MEKNKIIKFGYILREGDKKALDINWLQVSKPDSNISCIEIDSNKSIYEQGPFDFILHKLSDHLFYAGKGEQKSIRILEEYKRYQNDHPSTIFIDPLSTVLGLADRRRMFQVMDICRFECNGIKVQVPRWTILSNQTDIDAMRLSDFQFPIICKICEAGESPLCHSMQLLFNKKQLDELKFLPCVAQEFKNHDGVMSKIFVLGSKYFTCTRPSVRNFPFNGVPTDQIDSISFFSHDVAKLASKTFLNNYQNGFVYKNSCNGDPVLDDQVVKKILSTLAKSIQFSILGVDIIITDGGKTYNLVDINFLPSFDGVPNRGAMIIDLVKQMTDKGKYIQYWTE